MGKNAGDYINGIFDMGYGDNVLTENKEGTVKPLETEQKQEGVFKIDTQNFSEILNEYYKQSKKHQQEVWEREDSAYQRAAEDARKAGINLNLVGLEPADTTSTMSENLSTGLTSNLDKILKDLENEFKKEENNKDRQNEMAGKVIIGIVSIIAALIAL